LVFLSSNVFKADKLGLDISFIALPAAVALAADPIASLVDTAFVGRIGTTSVDFSLHRVMLSAVKLDTRRSRGNDCDTYYSYYRLALTNFDFVLLGPVELAAVGVSISVFNLVSKMFNVPLLNVTTSFVAEDASQESSGVDIVAKSEKCKSSALLSADREIFNLFL